jgi:hypothetical protein
VRLALAYLASRNGGRPGFVRWPFDNFWQALLSKDPLGRRANVNASLNGIYRAIGVERGLRG